MDVTRGRTGACMTSCILLTGGAGFIGCEIARRLPRDLPIVAVDNLHPQVHRVQERPDALPADVILEVADIRDSAFWDDFFKRYQPELIYHLAAETGTGQSLTESSRHASTNVTGTAEMLDGLSRHGIKPGRIVLSSSRAVYGEGAWSAPGGELFYPGVRSHAQLASGQWDFSDPTGAPARPVSHKAAVVHPRPTSVYGGTKLAQEHILTAWTAAMGVPLSILRFQNVYGPGQSPDNAYTGIITLFHRQASAGKTLEIYEDGAIGRDFVYIDDVVSACVAAARADGPVIETIDIGSGVATTILEAANMIAEYHGAPVPVVCGKFRDGDVRWAVADTSEMQRTFGERSYLSFRDGSHAVAQWLKARGII
jgi:dTDP-L-rhamnose 4-epimerase